MKDILVHTNPVFGIFIAALLFYAIVIAIAIYKDLRNERRRREQMFTAGRTDPAGLSHPVQDWSGDCRTVHLARLVNEVPVTDKQQGGML